MQWVPILAKFNSYITAAITASGTSCVLNSVTSIPTAPFHAVLDGGTTLEEIVKVTAVTTATKTLTIVRAQGSTTGVAHGDNSLFHACEIDSVQLHLDAMTRTLAGSTGLDAVKLTVTDTTTQSDGYSQGMYITVTSTGDKTSTAELHGLSVDITLTGANVPYVYNLPLYMVASGNPTIGYASAVSIYFDDLGTAVSGLVAVDIMLALPTASAPADRYTYIRCRNMSTGVPTSVLLLEGGCATYLIKITSSATLMTVSATALSGITTSHKIAIRYDTTTMYIPVVTTGMA